METPIEETKLKNTCPTDHKACIEKYDGVYCLFSNNSELIKTDMLPNNVPSKNIIVEILLNNFEDEYTTPFLLYSLGYKYEEIASLLTVPIGIIKSRIFYVQKKMKILLMKL